MIQPFWGITDFKQQEISFQSTKKVFFFIVTKKTRIENEILYTIENYSTTIIMAEAGSGKTTQIPQF